MNKTKIDKNKATQIIKYSYAAFRKREKEDKTKAATVDMIVKKIQEVVKDEN